MKKKAIILIIALIAIIGISGCIDDTASSGIGKSDIPQLTHSVEQDNLKARLEIMNKPETTLFLYGLSETGTIIFKSTVKGKVTSSMKRLESSDYTSDTGCTEERLQADGTYGSSDPYVFWFDFQNNYFQWNGKYILSTSPLKIPTPSIEFQQTTEAD